jgi:hypothetical protein
MHSGEELSIICIIFTSHVFNDRVRLFHLGQERAYVTDLSIIVMRRLESGLLNCYLANMKNVSLYFSFSTLVAIKLIMRMRSTAQMKAGIEVDNFVMLIYRISSNIL